MAQMTEDFIIEELFGSSLDQLEFDKMTATAYIEENGNFSRIAWSLRASDVRPPAKGAKPATDKAAA